MMAERVIDLNRCLFQYTTVDCHRCEQICPQEAIQNRQVDPTRCDDCGLCTAVCPVGAVQSGTDYDSQLSRTQRLEPQVLMCQRADAQGMPCLGALNRRLLWALADGDQALAIDCSRCAECKPAVDVWLRQELDACNEALAAVGRPEIARVRVREAAGPEPARQVGRRGFFRSLIHSAAEGVESFTESQQHRQYMFDPVIWIEKQQPEPAPVFPGVVVSPGCTGCGLCRMMCPEQALVMETRETGVRISFDPVRCTGCGLCTANCPQNILELMPSFTGIRVFDSESC